MVTAQAMYEEVYNTAKANLRYNTIYGDAAVLSAVGDREHLHRIDASLRSVRSTGSAWCDGWLRPGLAVLTGARPLERDEDMELFYLPSKKHVTYGVLDPMALATYEVAETRKKSERIRRAQRHSSAGHHGATLRVPVLPFHIEETSVPPMVFDPSWAVSPVLLPWFAHGSPPFKGQEGTTQLLRKLQAVQKVTTMDLSKVIRSTALYELKAKTFRDRGSVRYRLSVLTEPVQSLNTPAFYLFHEAATASQKIEGMQHLCGNQAEWTKDIYAGSIKLPVAAVVAVRTQSLPEVLYRMHWGAVQHLVEDEESRNAVLAHLLRFFGKAAPHHLEKCLIDHPERADYQLLTNGDVATSAESGLALMESGRRLVTMLAEDMLDACGGDRYLAALVWIAGGVNREAEKDINRGLVKHLDQDLVRAAESFLPRIYGALHQAVEGAPVPKEEGRGSWAVVPGD